MASSVVWFSVSLTTHFVHLLQHAGVSDMLFPPCRPYALVFGWTNEDHVVFLKVLVLKIIPAVTKVDPEYDEWVHRLVLGQCLCLTYGFDSEKLVNELCHQMGWLELNLTCAAADWTEDKQHDWSLKEWLAANPDSHQQSPFHEHLTVAEHKLWHWIYEHHCSKHPSHPSF